MTIPEHLHANYNALEEAIKGTDAWKAFEPNFRELILFFGDQMSRSRFIGVCMVGSTAMERRVFHSFTGSKFEWRF